MRNPFIRNSGAGSENHTRIYPMEVTYVTEGSYTFPTPAFDRAWPMKKQIAWKLGCAEAQGMTGLWVDMFPTNWCISALGMSSTIDKNLNSVWEAISWIEFGYKMAKGDM